MVIYKFIVIKDALKALALERPLNPVEFFSYFLLTRNNENDN